ncbi:MAG: tetratricopeptide repeat protein [Pedobacter sp.]|nr:MAG: tetratricopeptide repeat protein [Pedobacter sp.]
MPYVQKRVKPYLLVLILAFSTLDFAKAQTTKVNELLVQLDKVDSDTARIKVLRKLSVAYSSVDPVKKFYYADQYRLLAERLGVDSLVSAALLDMGNSYGLRSNLDSALYYFRLGHEKAKASNYTMGIGRGYVNIGYVLDRLDRKKEAIKYYQEALKIFKATNYKKGINQCIINLGSMYFDLSEYRLADQYFQQALDNAREIKQDEVGLGNALYALAGAKWKIGEVKRSMALYQQSLALREKIGDLSGIALSNWGIGQLHMDKKQYGKSLAYYEIALKNNRAIKNLYQECAVLIDMSKAYLGLKDYSRAESSAKLALVRARESSSKIGISLALERLAAVSEAQKNFEQALGFQKDYISVKDSLNHDGIKKDVMATDLNRVNSDNQVLAKDNIAIAGKNSEYVLVIAIITVLLVMVAIMMVLYYRRNRQKIALNLLLQRQKRETAEANEELSAVNEELISQMEIVSGQNIELEKLNNVKNKFFSIVSHDLRGPLITLKTLFGMYREGDVNEQELNSLLIKLEDTTYTTVDFLDNLLQWSKSQLEGMVVNPSPFSMDAMVEENIKLIDSQVKLKGIRVLNSIDHDVLVFADHNMINVAVRNLLSNAIKFCKAGDTVSFQAREDAGMVICMISDSGPGINELDKKNLFNFSHTVATGSSGETGYHIGLILCREMVLQNNGNITVESTLGEGTRFHITLPKGV